MDSRAITDTIMKNLRTKGHYYCKPHCFLHNAGKAMDRAEYERRAFNNPPRPEDLQVMRYLARMDYADIYLLTMAAEAYHSERGNSGITDSMYIKQILKKLLDIGIVHERRYVTELSVDSNGNPLTTDKTPLFYCLSGYGQRQYKDLSLSTEYLEEFPFSKSDFEIMKRLAGNYAVLKCHKDFSGKYITAASDKFDKLGRMPIYGKFVNDEHVVFFEPVFFNYDSRYVKEEEFRNQLKLRARFITRALENAGNEKTKSLVILVEDIEHLKEAIKAYEGAIDMVERLYATSEYVLSYAYSHDNSTKNAFLKVTPAAEGKFSIIAEEPIFYH